MSILLHHLPYDGAKQLFHVSVFSIPAMLIFSIQRANIYKWQLVWTPRIGSIPHNSIDTGLSLIFLPIRRLSVLCGFLMFGILGTQCVNAAGNTASIGRGDPQCVKRKVVFNGVEPISYARLPSDDGGSLPLYAQYPESCINKSSKACKIAGKIHVGNTVGIGKVCGEWAYVQFLGKAAVITAWTSSKRLERLPVPSEPKPEMDSSFDLNRHYQFRLTSGYGRPVCEAYLQRLNQTTFHRPPYCGRPESKVVPGFESLNRTRLNREEFNRLSPVVTGLITHQHPTPTWMPANKSKFTPSAWRYEPSVDLDNDEKPDNLVIWDDEDVTFPSCGMPGGPKGVLGRGGQYGIVLSPDGRSVDEMKTNLLFGQLGLDEADADRSHHPLSDDHFQPIGEAVGVFRYMDTTYFDTFFDSTYHYGAMGAQKLDPDLQDTVGVYLRQKNATRQVCEYSLINSKE